MTKTPTVDVSCETETKQKRKKTVPTAQHRQKTYVDDRCAERRPEIKTKLPSRFDRFVMGDGRKRAPKTQATNASSYVPRVPLVRFRRQFTSEVYVLSSLLECRKLRKKIARLSCQNLKGSWKSKVM